MRLVQRQANKGYLDTWLWVPKTFVNVEGVKNALTFTFADSYSENKTSTLFLFRETHHHLLVPRAFWDPRTMGCEVVDCRPTQYAKTGIKSRIKLDHRRKKGKLAPTGKDVQRKALSALLAAQSGVLQLGCGKGKTVVFLELATRLEVPTLIIVDNTFLMEQWYGEILRHLAIDPSKIGRIQAEAFDWQKPIVLATYHTIASRAESFPEEARRFFGLIGWDEGHHIAAPTFAKSADLFYGKRVALTATPVRDDGLHVVYDMHIGPVIYKDLTQDLKPLIVFKWTNLQIDDRDPDADIRARNREIHLSKVYSYFGRWRQRLDLILSDTRAAVAAGREKILVLSNSVAEVVNLTALWIFGPDAFLYSSIPTPLPEHVGETLPPVELSKKKHGELKIFVESAEKQLNSHGLNPIKEQNLRQAMSQAKMRLHQHHVWEKIKRHLERTQKWYVRELRKFITDAGLMIHEIPAKVRFKYVDDCRVVFAIMKYGKEGLDAADLDTIAVCEPFSSRNGLQQLMGRPTRPRDGKKQPIVLIYEDNLGPIIGMCQKLRKHLREWPHEEGGPFEYEMKDEHQWT